MLRRVRSMLFLTLAVAMISLAALAASATADTTLGSKLEDGYEAAFGGTTGITVYQEAAPSEVISAPAGGTITSWSVRSGDLNAKYELRVLHPVGNEFTAAGTSAPQTVPDSEDKVRGPYSVSLSVTAGDRIALYVVKGLGAPINNTLSPPADELNYLQDPFSDGSTKAPALTPPLGGTQELLLQANFAPAPPVNKVQPAISGEARAGVLLTASEGTWEDATSFAFQWLRCTGATCQPIIGATGRTYAPASVDEGRQLRVDVTASGEGGHTIASSELTDGVKPGPLPPPENTGLPLISGEARDTETLTGTDGYWAGASSARAYQWLRCASAGGANCSPIPGAERNSYTLTRADVGSTVRLRVTATNASGPSAADSSPTAIVQPLTLRAKLVLTPANACAGTPVEVDAGSSQTPNPPLTYSLRAFTHIPVFQDFAVAPTDPTQYWDVGTELANGPQPRHVYTFTWDRTVTESNQINELIGSRLEVTGREPIGQLAFDPVLFQLTVKDASGATSLGFAWLKPARLFSGQSASACPKSARVRASAPIFSSAAHLLIGRTALSTSLRCVTAAPCAGSISVVPATHVFSRAAAQVSPPRTPPPVIAGDPSFHIRGHHTGTIHATLTRAGRALLKRGKAIQAIVQLTGIGRDGVVTSQSFHVTLRRK